MAPDWTPPPSGNIGYIYVGWNGMNEPGGGTVIQEGGDVVAINLSASGPGANHSVIDLQGGTMLVFDAASVYGYADYIVRSGASFTNNGQAWVGAWGADGPSTFTSWGNVNIVNQDLRIAWEVGSANGIVTVNDGTFNVANDIVRGHGTATFNFNGGTLTFSRFDLAENAIS
jgi:hypothetical protein